MKTKLTFSFIAGAISMFVLLFVLGLYFTKPPQEERSLEECVNRIQDTLESQTKVEFFREPDYQTIQVASYRTISKDTGDNTPCYTSNGSYVCKLPRDFIRCPKKYPLGTRVYIPDINFNGMPQNRTFTCQDRAWKETDQFAVVVDQATHSRWGVQSYRASILK